MSTAVRMCTQYRVATAAARARCSSMLRGAAADGACFASSVHVHRRRIVPGTIVNSPRGKQSTCSTTFQRETPEVHTQSCNTLEALEQKLGFKFSSKPTVPPPTPRIFVISGASGVGKDAVIQRLQEQSPDLYFVVTATDRPKRETELHGRDYFFVSTDEFKQMIADEELLEYAVVYGSYKGIPKEQVRQALARNTDVVLRLDVQGAKALRELIPEVISIFLVAESEAALVSRLVSRGTEEISDLMVRVQTAREEVAQYKDFDYVIQNASGKLGETAAEIGSIIAAEKRRTSATTFITL